eukprot:g467.t1
MTLRREISAKVPTREEFLVKWCGLSYSSSTWEPRDELTSVADKRRIAEFFKHNRAPSGAKWAEKVVPRTQEHILDDVSLARQAMEWELPNEVPVGVDAEVARVLGGIIRCIEVKQFVCIDWEVLPKPRTNTSSGCPLPDAPGFRPVSRQIGGRKKDALVMQHPMALKRGSMVPYRRSPRFKGGLTLRDYQVGGLNWLINCWYNRQGSILADEMGLGKTAQIAAFFNHLYQKENIRGPFLAVVPLSTIEHWRREIERWTDLNCCVYYDRVQKASLGTADVGREVIRDYEWRYDRPVHLRTSPDYSKFDVMVTTYETLAQDVNFCSSFHWQAMVADEGHRLKNPESRTAVVLTEEIRAHHRIILTGTPIQNNTSELWALLHFVQPIKFASRATFEAAYGKIQTSEQVANLRADIHPYILRRLKSEVATAIPPKRETVVDIELTTLQKQFYRAIFEKNREFLYRGCHGQTVHLSNVEMQLRKCCNHPFLLEGVENQELEKIREALSSGTSLSALDELEALAAEEAAKKKRDDAAAEAKSRASPASQRRSRASARSSRMDSGGGGGGGGDNEDDDGADSRQLTPEFYDTYEGDWCRYCGARDTSCWSRSPWGSRMLCMVHFHQWWERNQLDLTPWTEEPQRPIDLSKNTEDMYQQFKKSREQTIRESAQDNALGRRKKVDSVDPKKKSMQGCEYVLRKMASHKNAQPFLMPVDVARNPMYLKVIRRPMDLSTVYKRVKGIKPHKPYDGAMEKFARDMRLIFRNCMEYNDEASALYRVGRKFSKWFDELYLEWVVNTARKDWTDVMERLGDLPLPWRDFGLSDTEGEEDGEEFSQEEGSGTESSLRAVPLRRLRRRLRRKQAELYRIDEFLAFEEEDAARTLEEAQLAASRPQVSAEIERLENAIEVKEEIENNRVDRLRLQRMVDVSGKLVLIDKLLPKLRARKHRVLIFSQFKIMLDILQQYLVGRGYPYERIDGGVHGDLRQLAIDRFCDPDSDSFIFLLSTKAGGVGINLTAADTVIIYDSDWNPQNDLQATARCHRIGQTNEVTIYRLITRGTYEGQMFERASRKLGLERAVMSGDASGSTSVFSSTDQSSDLPTSVSDLSGADLEKLLRQGAYGAAADDGSKALQFCERSIDDILENSSREVTYFADGSVEYKDKRAEGEAGSPGKSAGARRSSRSTKGRKASKDTVQMMSFTSAGGNASIDINDPNFWEKLMPGMRSARALLVRLNDETCLSRMGLRQQFFRELSELVDELTEAKLAGEDVSPQEWETAKGIVLRVSCLRNTFNSSQCEKAEAWYSMMEGSRKRRHTSDFAALSLASATPHGKGKGRKRGRGGDYDFEDEFSDDPDYESAKGQQQSRGARRKSGAQKKAKSGGARSKAVGAEYMDACALCEDGGELLCCEGPCMRTFHPKCVGLDKMPASASWYCPDCLNKAHLCLVCNMADSDMPNSKLNAEDCSGVFLCDMPNCGRYYHKACLMANPLTSWLQKVRRADGSTTYTRATPSTATSFRCMQHRCKASKELSPAALAISSMDLAVDSKTVGARDADNSAPKVSSADKRIFLRCMRCEDGYYKDRADLESCMRIQRGWIVCKKHTGGQLFNWERSNKRRRKGSPVPDDDQIGD